MLFNVAAIVLSLAALVVLFQGNAVLALVCLAVAGVLLVGGRMDRRQR
jgi:hypothetical protein